MDKYGFVYIWRDRKHKRFYIGCHWGAETDGYICSSKWMKNSYKRRPEDFKRRILARTSQRELLLIEEAKWLSLIKPEELKVRYYNAINKHFNHWSADPVQREQVLKTLSEKTKEAMHRPEIRTKVDAWNSSRRGKTYEELYGEERAAEMKAARRMAKPPREELATALQKFRPYELAKQYGVANKTIKKWAIEYGLPFDAAPKIVRTSKYIPDKEELEFLHLQKRMSIVDLSKHFRVDKPTMIAALETCGIERRKWHRHDKAKAA